VIFEKKVEKTSLHMKDHENDSKTQKYFDFSKMDKKNVQKWKVKKLLTDKKFCLDIENLWSHFKPEIFIL